MNGQTYTITSIVVSSTHTILITNEGQVITLLADGTYDLDDLVEFISTELADSNNSVVVDLNNFLTDPMVMSQSVFQGEEEDGISTVITIDGREVEGVFYPNKKLSVAVKTETGVVTVPGIDKLARHVTEASETQSPGIRNMIKRLTPVISSRLHSVEDLMEFLSYSNLPITDDGMIIAYRRMNRCTQDGVTKYVDVHTGKVKQRIGSVVTMDIDKVDDNRNSACSAGLHVASIDYLGSFTGSAIAMVLVAPEDFIAVPEREVTKARVCRYRIVADLPTELYMRILKNPSVDDPEFTALLDNILAGNYPPAEEIIQVDSHGENTITPIAAPEPVKPVVSKAKPRTNKKPEPPKAPTPQSMEDTKEKARAKKKTVPQQCRSIYETFAKEPTLANLRTLLNFKTEKKKGFAAMGLTKEEIAKVERMAAKL